MRIKILQGRVYGGFESTWYTDHVGEEFDVEDDPKFPEMYMNHLERKGKMQKHHIFKEDCEVVNTG